MSYIHTGQAGAFVMALPSADPSFLSSAFHSRSIGISAPWPAIVRDEESDRLLDQAAADNDPNEQCHLYDRFQERYLQAAAAYPIWDLTLPVAYDANLVGVHLIAATGIMPAFQEISIAE